MKNKAARDGVRPYWLLPYYFEVPVDGLVLEPVLPDVLLLGVLADVSVDVLPEALQPVAPADVPALPLDCAHEAPATATNAAATAAAIVLTITIKSPWSVEQELQRPTCKTGASRPVVRFRPDAAAREVAACTTPLA